MAGLMDILLALVKVLCGGSTTQEQPPSEYEKPHAERPHRQVSVAPYMTPLDGQLFFECVINEITTLDTLIHRSKNQSQYLTLVQTIGPIRYFSSGPFLLPSA